jgi:hypothetical protein
MPGAPGPLGALAAATLSVGAAPPAKPVYTAPAAIASNCSVAVDAALNAWIARVPDGATILFPPRRCYGIDGELRLDDRRDLTLDGRGSTFRALTLHDPRRAIWHMSGGRRLTLRNMIVRGFSPQAGVHSSYYIGGRSYEWQHAYEFSGVSGGLLDHVQAYGVYGDFVEAQADQRPGRRAQPSRGITVRGSRFAGAARQGFGLTSVDGMTIEGNRVRDVAQAGVDLEPDPPHPLARNVTVAGNTFADVWLAIVSVNGIAPANTDGVGNVSITGNTMRPPTAPGRESCFAPIWVNAANGASTANYTIARNRLVSIGPGIYMMGVRGARISGNRLTGRPGCRRSAAVELHRSTGVVVGANQFGGRPAVLAAAE